MWWIILAIIVIIVLIAACRQRSEIDGPCTATPDPEGSTLADLREQPKDAEPDIEEAKKPSLDAKVKAAEARRATNAAGAAESGGERTHSGLDFPGQGTVPKEPDRDEGR